ncbi:hypothetical protein JXA02_10410 [candidate division KSB1 bacterium]|nr:hypothetical protein [candidate division KSB1 bacterium]RQW03367.1 MAG: hypothetical protein EH222_12510 [candidate division KSB1 bacterium]
MKSSYFLSLIVFFAGNIHAQLLTWTPYFATIDDTITITYDARQGSAGLVGAAEVYAHTGVLTESSSGSSDWKHVIADWGQNISKAKMTALGDDKWRLRFHIRSYYGLAAGEPVTHLAFVFRNATGSRTGKTESGGDIFLPIFKPGLHLARLSPPCQHNVRDLGDSLNVLVIASRIVNFALYIDDTLIRTIASDSLQHRIILNDLNKHHVDIFVSDGAESRSVSFYYLAEGPTITSPLPEGTQDGITYHANGDITLVMHAPHKNFLYVIGDWTSWEADPALKMKETPDGDKYWLTLSGLDPNASHAYQYLVDSRQTIADPYAELVLDPEHDKYITAATYPNLPPYPAQAEGIVSVLSAQKSYAWQAHDYQRPAKESLIIYELLLRDFLRTHDYKTLTDTLRYFEKLGVNAIELMPVSEFEGNSSWGYNPSFYFAPDKYYGPKADLQRFIDEAHRRGIAVIQDIVLNHSYGQSPMVQLYAENMRLNPWYNETSPNPVYAWGYDFNHASAATRTFVDRVTKHWLTEYRMDGFRFDFSKGFTNRPGDGWARDDSRIAILKRMADAVWSIDSTAYIILEHFTEESEEKELAEYGMLIWGNSNHDYGGASIGQIDSSDFSGGSYKNRGWSAPHLVTYMESHDEERLMFKNLQRGNSSGSYDIKNLQTALERIELAATFFFTLPGPKMFWQFGELGYDYSITYNGRLGSKPIRWDYANQVNRKRLHDVFAALIRLKREQPAFSSASYTTSFGQAVKWLKINHESMNVLIVGNFDVREQSKILTFHHPGQWYDYISGDSLSLESVRSSVTLAPGEYLIFTDKRLQKPLISQVYEGERDCPDIFELYQNSPNPFNPSTTIRFAMQRASHVALDIFNIRGQKIKTLVNDFKSAGEHHICWDGRDEAGAAVASGIYLYELFIDDWRVMKKMTLLH